MRGLRGLNVNLTKGPILRSLIIFALPLLLSQLMQTLYNMADAWVVGNFASNDAFAAVSMSGNTIFLIVGFCNGIAIGGGVVISRYFGMQDEAKLRRAIQTNILFGIVASALATVLGLTLIPLLLTCMNVPDSVMPDALTYFRIYFAGVTTVVMYNICMAIMRSLGDSVYPLIYLIISSVTNVILDLLFVAAFRWGVAGAAVATVLAQGLSVVLCLIRMLRSKEENRLDLKDLRFDRKMAKEVIIQGLPTGIQNSVISLGNVAIQASINSFGAYAISGQGAYTKLESIVFMPIMAITMALPTFVSQNLGAGEYERARRGALTGIALGALVAELLGILFYFVAPYGIHLFVSAPEAIEFGAMHAHTTALFFFALAFSHCTAGALRGCGKSFIPMLTMLICWCGVRVAYVTFAVQLRPIYSTVAAAYPLTWSLSTIVFILCLRRIRWDRLAGRSH